MSEFWKTNVRRGGGGGDDGGNQPPPRIPPRRSSLDTGTRIIGLILALGVAYGLYFWAVRRVVVGPGQVMVLLKKDGTRSLPADQIIIPRPPDKADTAAYVAWEKQYADCNGIFEQVYPTGVYFAYSPWDYERIVVDLGNADVPADKIGVVVKKFGAKLDAGQVLADLKRDQRGPLPGTLAPGKYYQYANPYAYEVKLVEPIQVNPGHRGVVTNMAAGMAKSPDEYLVEEGEQGVQRHTEPEGFRYINPYEKRVIPVTIRSQRFEMTGDESIRFPSSDSFDIKMEGFVEWAVIPDRLPLLYTQYGEGNDLLPFLEEKVILPYARSYCRLVGSQYSARDFISGDTKLKFQQEFETKLRESCETQGIEVLQALVRDIVPPDSIKQPINEREIAKQQIKTLEQQILVAKSQADLATQEAMAEQNQAIGDANKQVVQITKKAEQQRDVAVTKANQELAVAKLRLEAAQKQADATVAMGQADANVILLQQQAQAEPLRQQVQAFGGDGNTYAQYFFYQKVAPSVKSIMANSDGPFADLFKQFLANPPAPKTTGEKAKVTQAQP
jgi:regulator of protease activity HflC (stomatin/prohibitin superfamily)